MLRGNKYLLQGRSEQDRPLINPEMEVKYKLYIKVSNQNVYLQLLVFPNHTLMKFLN